MARRTVSGPPASPDVSVVVIGYNDRKNLPKAIRSVLGQSLRNLEVLVVDDCSTDDSVQLAEEIAREDSRVSVVRLPENSGGCSRPRNVGIERARAPYVMFLDSDDVYERHACKNLLLAAERTGADVVSGKVVRIHLAKNRESPWAKKLFTGRAVYRGVRENPLLFFDPLSTNKIYRREFLDRNDIRFPEGVHYEDSLFSTEVYCQAETIAVIPNVVYYWRVVADAEEAEASITQRRYEFENFRDRIAVHRMMDDFLREHGSADLKVHKDFKFIRHDLKLYLSDLPERDDDYQRKFMQLAADYLATVSEETLAMVLPVERVCVHLIRRLDVAGTLSTVDYLRFGFKLSTDLVERDGRVYWSGKYLDTPEDRAAMDVTEMGFHRLPFERLALHNLITSVRLRRSVLHIEGRVVIPLARIRPDDDLELFLNVKSRAGGGTSRSRPVRDWRIEGDRLFYRTDIDLTAAVGELDQENPVWDVRMEIRRGAEVNVSPIAIDPTKVAGRRIPVRARLGRTATGYVVPFVTARLNLAFEQAPDTRLSAVGARADFLRRRASHSVRWRSSRTIGNNAALRALAYKVFRRLPVKPGLAVFESHMGKQYSDSPRYIYEAAVAAGLDRLGLDPVWSYARRTDGFPTDVRLVRRDSWRYHLDLARAEFWVDNQGFPRAFARRRETTYVQTWHGTPLKRMGFDSPALERAGAGVRRQQRAMVKRWSALLVPSEYFVETFVKSYGYQGRLVRKGLPRNDLLVRGADEAWVRAKKRELGLPTDRRLVLYCPTFRDRARRLGTSYVLPLDLEPMRRELGGDVHLLLRPHYLDNYKLSPRFAPFATDVSRHHDVTELMLLADVLVTDYSSVMFDFANSGKPMVFYTYDYQDYVRDERGTYFDLPDVAPGPMVATHDELVQALRSVDDDVDRYRERYAAFRDRFCTYESGHAAEAVVDEFFTRGESS